MNRLMNTLLDSWKASFKARLMDILLNKYIDQIVNFLGKS